MHQISYLTRPQVAQICVECFNASDQDKNGLITIYEFFNFLQLAYQKLNLYRTVN